MRIATTLLLSFTALSAFGWNATGHMTVADIAYRNLTPEVKAEVDRLAKLNAPERSPDFITAACWADDTRTKENGPWHYIDLYFRADGKPTDLKPDAENVVWAIDKFSKVLADKSASDADRAEALRYITHFVGDIHQPLHCSSRVTDAQPKGDAGGNKFFVQDPASVEEGRRPRNLHSLWDSGCGEFKNVQRPLTDDGKKEIDKLADDCLAALTDDDRTFATTVTDPNLWAAKGQSVAETVVYATPENTPPSATYLDAGKTLSKKLVAEAGLRLAAILNKLLAPTK